MIKVYKYREKMGALLIFVEQFNFLDKNHIVDKNCRRKKVRKWQITGVVPVIFAGGNSCY